MTELTVDEASKLKEGDIVYAVLRTKTDKCRKQVLKLKVLKIERAYKGIRIIGTDPKGRITRRITHYRAFFTNYWEARTWDMKQCNSTRKN